MSLQVKFPFGRGQGPLHTCRSCGFGTRHRVLFERHTKRCPAEVQRVQQLQAAKLGQPSSHRHQMPPPVTSLATALNAPALPLPPVCRNYKCEKCTFTTNKSRIFLFHQREVHGENITIYVCDHCEYASRHKNKVYRHRKLVHKDAAPIDEIPSESDAALQQFVMNQDKPIDVEHNEPAEVSEEELMRSSYTNLNGSPSMVNPRQVDERYATYDFGDADLSFRGNSSANLDSSAYETVDEETLDDGGDPINQNPDPTDNAYDYIIKAPEFSIDSPMYKCKMCYYSNPHKWKIANHIRTIHMKKTLFKCPYCDFVCERKIEWCVHKTTHTSKVVYSCQECQYRTTMKRNFDRHQARHRSGGPIKCSMCSYSSTGEAAIQRHMAEYHPSPPKEEGDLASPSAVKSWTAASVTPLKLPPRYCRTPEQPERMNSFSPVSTPSGTPRPSSQPSSMSSTCSSPADVICPVCGLNVKTESKLKIHMVSHSSEAHWTCPMCPLRYKRAADLNRHMKRKHAIRLCDYRNGAMPASAPLQEQEQPLDLCVKKMSDESDDEEHDQPLDLSMKAMPASPTPQRPVVYKPENLKCSHCSYLAKWPSDLRRHMLVHSIEKRFRCQYCNKKYKYQFDLNMHLRKTHKIPAGRTRIGTVYIASSAPPKPAVHPENEDRSSDECSAAEAVPVNVPATKPPGGGKPDEKARHEDSLKCKFCKYVGKYRAEVERHMRLHTGKKPYHCMFCVYKSFWKGDMKRHLQKHHAEEIDTSGRDIKVLVNDTFRPSDDEQAEGGAPEPAALNNQDDLMDYASLIEPEDDQQESFAAAYPTYPEFGQTVFPGMEPNNNSAMLGGEHKGGHEEDCSPSPVPWTETNNNTPEKGSLAPGDPKKVCKCPRCPFVCEAPSKLKCHMEIHDNLKRFMCPQCGKRSNWLWDVRKHIRKEHPGAPMDVTEMSEEDARNTLEEYLAKQRSPSKANSKERSLSPGPARSPADHEHADGNSILNQMLTIGGQFIKQEPHDPDDPEDMRYDSGGPVFPGPVSLPFSRSSQRREEDCDPASQPPPSKRIAVGRYRPFKCSKCGRRSNWRWDLNKHIRQAHGSAKIITLSDEEARTTFHECLQGTPQQGKGPKVAPVKMKAPPPPPPTGRYRPFKCSKCNRRSNWKWDMNKHIRQVHPDATLIELSEEEARATYHEVEMPADTGAFVGKLTVQAGTKLSPTSKSNLTQDIHKLKRFKCSGCPYRSNFRSDIGRHIKRKHRRASVHVDVLDLEEAAATLAEYKEVWAKKKFVPSPAKISPKRAACLRAMRHEITYTTATPANTSAGSLDLADGAQPKILSNIGRIPSNPLIKHGTTSLRAKVWRCSKCNFKDRNKKVVVKHFRTHSDGTAFMCRVCGECADYRSTLVRHVRTKHHREDLVNCILETAIEDSSIPIDQIPSYSNGANMGEMEMEKNEASGPSVGYILKHYNCRLCDVNSGDRDEVVAHIQECHPEEAEPADAVEEVDKITPAPPEETYATSPTSEHRPRLKSENTQKALKCKHCPYRTNKQGLLKIHSTYHKPQPGNKYKCKYCPYYVCASRLLHQHQALHEKEHREQGVSFHEEYPGQLDEGPVVVECVPRLALPVIPTAPRSTSRARHFCDKCPYVSINKNDFIYHKQFHRPRPTAILKCDHCPYWVNLKRLLTQHMKVHTTQYKIQYYPPGMLKELNLSLTVSPAKSDVSSDDEDDAIHVANLKQQIITSKITSVPITPEKLRPGSPDPTDADRPSPLLVLNRSGQILTGGTYKRHHKCVHCPYVNVRATNLRLHEKMHAVNGGCGAYTCSFCDYHVGNKGLLSHHIKVHSRQYRPGEDDINDVEADAPEDLSVSREEGMEVDEQDEKPPRPPFKFPERPGVPSDPSQRVDAAKLPHNMEYYVKYDEYTGEHILEKATLKKWCCEKCPYATMKRTQFEKHVMLHSSNQKYTCEFCDYSVPGYHLLLQHKKLHLMPNPNLLSVQSISNLQKLPEVPADVAAATNYPNTTTESPGKATTSQKHGIHDQMDMYENSAEFSEPKKLYRCDRCPYTNIRRDHLLSHLKFHMIHSDMQCPYCDYSVTKVHLLNQHIKVHFNTPGGEMNALPATEKKDKPADKQPATAAAGAQGDDAQRQPEFIDIADLGKTLKDDGNDGDEPGALVIDESKGEQAEEGTKQEAGVTAAGVKAAGKPVETSGSDTETYDAVDEEPKPGTSDDGQANKENSGDGVKRRKLADKEGDCDAEKDPAAEARPSVLVCQYCDRSFRATDKLKRHERQHLVGSKF